MNTVQSGGGGSGGGGFRNNNKSGGGLDLWEVRTEAANYRLYERR